MTAPQIAAARFFGGILVGLLLGAWYGFLRPLGRVRRNLADFLFLALLFPAWVYYSFGICQGDLRPGYWPALLLGGWLFDRTAGRLVSPVWEALWGGIGHGYQKVKKFFRKTTFFFKKIFTYLRKLSTIMVYGHFRAKTRTGGERHDPAGDHKKRPSGKSAQQQADQGGDLLCHRVIYGGPSGAACGDPS